MRRIRSVLSLTAALVCCSASAALAVDACHRPPPAWYTAPRVTYTYSNSYGAGYGREYATHEYSAHRRYSYAAPRSSYHFRYPFARW
jgi:hypothetical protein